VAVNGDASEYFHYVRPIQKFAVTSGGVVRGLTYLMLGDTATQAGLYESIIEKRPPFGNIDTPAVQNMTYTTGQNITIAGWSLSTWPTFITIMVDGVTVTYFGVNVPRADVCEVFPGYTGCPNVGFNGYLDTSSLDPSCPHLVSIYSSDNVHNNDSHLAGTFSLVFLFLSQSNLFPDLVITPQ